jgi:nondiscriminating glutamyl-tRNA synthetase
MTAIKNPKTRFAPSPTGFMHFGNARTALFNVLYAAHLNGTCLLRIEDTDEVRSEDRYMQGIIEALAWLGLPWEGSQEGHKPVHQSERRAIYQEYYDRLIADGHAYECFCTEQELAVSRKVQLMRGNPPRYAGTCRHLSAEQREEKRKQGIRPALRFLVESGKTIQFEDVIRGAQTFLSEDIGDFIIRRGDGTAAFFFCNAIDDALMGVTHALRGEDHLSNTPRQIMLLETLGLTAPQYGHFPTILGQDGAPLSKRNGSRSIQDLKKAGYHPKGVINYMARLGHYYADNSLMDLSALGANFSLSHVNHAPAHFDEVQLNHWQKEAMRQCSLGEFKTFFDNYRISTQTKVDRLPEDFIRLIQPNIVMPEEGLHWAHCLLSDEVEIPADVQKVIEDIKEPQRFFEAAITALDNPNIDYSTWIKAIQAQTGLKGKDLYHPIRAIMTRQLSGPELEKVFALLGTQGIKARFEAVLKNRD